VRQDICDLVNRSHAFAGEWFLSRLSHIGECDSPLYASSKQLAVSIGIDGLLEALGRRVRM
jgi:hypothetical protein